MHPPHVRAEALRLYAEGLSANHVSRFLGVSRSAVTTWAADPEAALMPRPSACFRCQEPPSLPPAAAYSHLLGLYLGDGCVSPGPRGVYSLRIACCDAYPSLMDECEASVRAVRPGVVGRVRKQGCTDVKAYWKHWPCVFPQHRPGRKHDRAIVLDDWQRGLVAQEPGAFLRGLFHSDGCRIVNWTVRTVAGQPKRYEYPRYLFTNASADIRGLCSWALDLLDVPHTHPKERHISVARKEGVAVLDAVVGPKS